MPVEGGYKGVTSPQYLGPFINATKNKPVRIVFRNLLPTGAGGDLFLPTDSTMMGSGMVPMNMGAPTNDGTVLDEVRNPVCTTSPKPAACFKDNRATLHLHGGVTPWISDGTPHQWITPANESTSWPQGVQCPERSGHDRFSRRGDLRLQDRRVPDVLLHQPAERSPDVVPRPRVGHHTTQRLCR